MRHLPSAYSNGMDTNRIDGVLTPKFSADFMERQYAGVTANLRTEIRS